MKELYFISILGTLHTVMYSAAILLLICLICITVVLSTLRCDYPDDSTSTKIKYYTKCMKRIAIMLIIASLLAIIIPCKSDIDLIMKHSENRTKCID